MTSPADLRWYFGHSFQHCTLGKQLEQADLFRVPQDHYDQREVVERHKVGKQWITHYAQQIRCKPQYIEASYTPDGDLSTRKARVERFLMKHNPTTRKAFELIYGQESRWADNLTPLYQITNIGIEIVQAHRKIHPPMDGGQSLKDCPTQIISDDLDKQANEPNDIRGFKHKRMKQHAEGLWLHCQTILRRLALGLEQEQNRGRYLA